MDKAALAKEPFVSITTFKRDGTPGLGAGVVRRRQRLAAGLQ
jgi:hypothetical protein